MTKPSSRPPGVNRTSLRLALIVSGAVFFAIAASCGAVPDNLTGAKDGNGFAVDSGATDGGSGSDGGLTAANACSLMNSRKCDYFQRCGLIPPGQPALRDCASILVTTECGPSLWPSRVAVGTLRFYSNIARGCAESYVVRECKDFQRFPDLCGQFVTPGSALNSACYGGSFVECQTGVCRGLSCPRLCRPPGTLGEDCNGNSDCATDAGLYCVPGGTSSSGTCSNFATADAGCNSLTRCGEGLVCTSDGHCQALRNNGESCEEGSCVKTNWCAIATDGGGQVCAWRSVVGSNCTDDRQCQEGSVCVAESGKCGSRGPLPRGTPCGSGQGCTDGTACVGLTASSLGSCKDPYVAGEGCTGNADCVANLACVTQDAGVQLQCGFRRDDGQACTLDRDCRLFSACRSGTCFRLPRLSESCTGNDCVYGSCTPGMDGGSTCSGLLPPNAPCTFDVECSSARCAAGSCLAACTP